MGKFDNFKNALQFEREETIKRAKSSYSLVVDILIAIICVCSCMALAFGLVVLVIGLVILGIGVVMFLIVFPIYLAKKKDIQELNSLMTTDEKVKFFGKEVKKGTSFKKLITFDASVNLDELVEDIKTRKRKRFKCTYCGGKINEEDDICPGCGSRQFKEK